MTLHELASRFTDEIHELPAGKHNPFIQWCHTTCSLDADTPDEVPWCSSFLNAMTWILRLPRSKSAAARSWLSVRPHISLNDAKVGNDIVVLKRGKEPQPGPETIKAPGHVGVFSGVQDGGVWILGGNQRNGVTRQWFPLHQVLAVIRVE